VLVEVQEQVHQLLHEIHSGPLFGRLTGKRRSRDNGRRAEVRGHPRDGGELPPKVDAELLRKAYVVSAHVHRNQLRSSGEPYLIHPLNVAMILAEMRLDEVSIATGLLHDALEDTEMTKERLRELFGPDVAHLVDGVTKIGRYAFTSPQAQQAETFRKMLLAMTDDLRSSSSSSRTASTTMRTLEHLPDERRRAISIETMEIYAPLANRLGMGKIKGELEDLSFRFLYPDEWARSTPRSRSG